MGGVQNADRPGGKEKYHAIVCKRDGIKWNRRQAYRQYLGLDGMLSIDSTRANRSVVVKDISATGVSFVGDAGYELSFHGTVSFDV